MLGVVVVGGVGGGGVDLDLQFALLAHEKKVSSKAVIEYA